MHLRTKVNYRDTCDNCDNSADNNRPCFFSLSPNPSEAVCDGSDN